MHVHRENPVLEFLALRGPQAPKAVKDSLDLKVILVSLETLVPQATQVLMVFLEKKVYFWISWY